MTLTKRLQQDLTCTGIPWLPPSDPHAARLINEIVLGEESDEHPTRGYCSHFELYLGAMAEVGASTLAITHFIGLQHQGVEASAALQAVTAPLGVARFVESTLQIALNATTHCVAAAFLHGRESVIPSMFKRISCGNDFIEREAPTFHHYLNRHIEMDSQGHGPAAHRLLQRLIDAEPTRQRQAESTAISAMENRILFWNDVRTSMQEVHP